MKIDILNGPPDNIFKNRRTQIVVFVVLLFIAGCGLVLGAYAILAQTSYYEQFETLAQILFIAPSPFAFYVGQKLQKYKKLSPPQRENLTRWVQQYPEINHYYDSAAKLGRQPVRIEYEAFQTWVEAIEDKQRKEDKQRQKPT